MGTGVTCPSYRYRSHIVAQAFASLGLLYPGRIFRRLPQPGALGFHWLSDASRLWGQPWLLKSDGPS